MATLSDLRDQIKSDLILTGTAYDAQVDNAIRSALRKLRGKRYWFLKKMDDLTLVSGNYSVALPDDYGAPYMFELLYNGYRASDGQGFDFLTFDRLKREYWVTNPLVTTVPIACATLNDALYVSCIADQNYTIPITYYQQDATLPVSDSDTSVWFDDGYDLCRVLAAYMFKHESQGYTVNEEDGALVALYTKYLDEDHVAREAGR